MRLPKQWSDVTTEMYQLIHPIVISDEYETDLDKIIDIALAISEVSVNQLPVTELKRLSFLLTAETIPNKLPKAFTFKGKIYKTELRIEKIKGGQYIDLTTYTKDSDKIIDNLHYLIAIMTSNVNWFGFKKKYNADEMIKRAELFKKLPITITYPLCVFFCQVLINSTISIQDYSIQKAEQLMKEVRTSLNSLDGSLTSMQ
jgi:hypothetical protein